MNTTSQPRQKQNGAGHFQCTVCQRTYTRVDHLARHVRSHLQERPFKCSICNKAYGRPDLLKRHQICHTDERDGTRRNSSKSKNHANAVHSRRVNQACKYCAAAKIKCDDKKPCNGCIQRGMTCEYNVEMNDHRALLGMVTQDGITSDSTQSEDPIAAPSSPTAPSLTAQSETGATETTAVDTTVDSYPPLTVHEAPLQVQGALQPVGPSMISEFLRDVMTNTTPSTPLHVMHVENNGPSQSGPHGVLDFTVDMDLDLNDADFGFFDKLYSNSCNSFDDVPPPQLFATGPALRQTPTPYPIDQAQNGRHDQSRFTAMPYVETRQADQSVHEQPAVTASASRETSRETAATTTTMTQTTTETTSITVSTRQHVALGAEAFRRSAFGVWLPARQDCGHVELENLSILSPEGEGEVASPDTRLNISQDRHVLRDRLGRTTRDEFLAMILGTCRPEKVPLVVRTFPTSGLLDDLLECFFAYQQQQVDCFFHAPSFQPNEQQCELIAVMIATGATKTNIKALHKLGFAIQEAVRTVIPQRCESANANTRKLWLLQSFMSEMQIGIWSGIKRKMELAESHMYVIFTMLRRAGRFQDPKRPVPEPLAEDTGEVLHRKWLDWVEQESFKRLAFHMFISDAHVSMTMLTSPHISYAELSISFPDARELWMAEDAEQWKALYLARTPPTKRHCLLDFLQQPDEIPDYYDTSLAGLAVLAGIWGMTWQHLQLSAVLHRQGDVDGDCDFGDPFAKHQRMASLTALSSLRREDLLRTLMHFRVNIASSSSPAQCPSETALVLEVVSMYLFVNFGDIQLFAGKGDIDDARRILPSLQKWVTTEDARRAVWHAGQALKAASAFPPKQLDRFYAVAVYHAGLTLWAYGVISNSRSTEKGVSESAPSTTVCLDGMETPALSAFFMRGRHTPTVGSCRRDSEPVPLSNPQAVMDVVLETLRCNFPAAAATRLHGEGEGVAPLVDNLIQLLRDLGQAARNVEG